MVDKKSSFKIGFTIQKLGSEQSKMLKIDHQTDRFHQENQ
jgi:hypothetical protein